MDLRLLMEIEKEIKALYLYYLFQYPDLFPLSEHAKSRK